MDQKTHPSLNQNLNKKRDKLLIAGSFLSFIGLAWVILMIISHIVRGIHSGTWIHHDWGATWFIVLTFSVVFIPALICCGKSLKKRKHHKQKTVLAKTTRKIAIIGLALACAQLIGSLYETIRWWNF